MMNAFLYRKATLFLLLLMSSAAVAAASDSAPLVEAGNAANVTVLSEEKPEERRAKIADQRRQSEDRLLSLLREVGGDVPQLRDALRDYFAEESSARRPMRDVAGRLLSALRVGTSPDRIATPYDTLQRLRYVLGLEMSAGHTEKTLGGAEQKISGAEKGTDTKSEPRTPLRRQKPGTHVLGGNAFGMAARGTISRDAISSDSDVRVLASRDDEELRALVASMRQMQIAERERRAAREAELDAKLHFRDNPRLEAALLLLGIIGDSDYTISIKVLPNAQTATSPQSAASTREAAAVKADATISEKTP